MQGQWVYCATCKQPTSPGYACQRCGAPMAMAMPMAPQPSGGSNTGIIIGITLGVVVLLILGVGALAFLMVRNSAEEARSSSSYSSSYSTSGGSGGSSTTSTTKKAGYAIGDAVDVDDSTWKIVDVKDLGRTIHATSAWASTETKTTSGRFIRVHYKVTNDGKKQEVLLDTPKIIDSKSREFGAIEAEMDFVPLGTKTAILETLQPSMEKDFYSIIEVPSDASDLKVQVTGLGLTGTTETVDIDL